MKKIKAYRQINVQGKMFKELVEGEYVIMRTYKVSFIAINNNTLYVYLDK